MIIILSLLGFVLFAWAVIKLLAGLVTLVGMNDKDNR